MVRSRLSGLISAGLLVAACGGPTPISVPSNPGSTPIDLGSMPAASKAVSPPRTDAPATVAAPESELTPSLAPAATPTQITAPAASSTPKPTPAPTPRPTATSSPTPTPRPTPTPTPRPSPTPTAVPLVLALALEAKDFLFSPASLAALADEPFKIAFSNADPGVPHNVVVQTAAGVQVFSGAIITGVSTATYAIPAQGSGDYVFTCVVHPAMTGTLTVR